MLTSSRRRGLGSAWAEATRLPSPMFVLAASVGGDLAVQASAGPDSAWAGAVQASADADLAAIRPWLEAPPPVRLGHTEGAALQEGSGRSVATRGGCCQRPPGRLCPRDRPARRLCPRRRPVVSSWKLVERVRGRSQSRFQATLLHVFDSLHAQRHSQSLPGRLCLKFLTRLKILHAPGVTRESS